MPIFEWATVNRQRWRRSPSATNIRNTFRMSKKIKSAFVLCAVHLCVLTPKMLRGENWISQFCRSQWIWDVLYISFHFVSFRFCHLFHPFAFGNRILCLFGQEEFFCVRSKRFRILICAVDQFNVSSVQSLLVIVFWCIFFCVFFSLFLVSRLACWPLANN